MKSAMRSVIFVSLCILAAFAGLVMGSAPTGRVVQSAPATMFAEDCSPGITITSIERVDTGTLSETFLVKWNTSSACVTGFEITVEATRQNGEKRDEKQKFKASERSGLFKLLGSRNDNRAKSVRARITAFGVLAGQGSGSLGQSTVATTQPATATKPTFAISGKVLDAEGRRIPDVKIEFALVSSKGIAVSQLASGGNSGSVPVPQPVVVDLSGGFVQKGFQFGQSFRVTPSRSGFTFTPASKVVTIENTDVQTDFRGIASPSFAVAGFALGPNGTPIPGVTVTFMFDNPTDAKKAELPPPVQTASNGRWARNGFTEGIKYTAVASKAGLSFFPSTHRITGPNDNLEFSTVP